MSIENFDEDIFEEEILFKNANEHVKKIVQLFLDHQLDILFDIKNLELILSDDTWFWNRLMSYKVDEDGKVKTLDTADREIVEDWVWNRFMGYERPFLVTQKLFDSMKNKITSKNAYDNLYETRKVKERYHEKFTNSKQVSIEFNYKSLPEHVIVSGMSEIADVVNEFITENIDEIQNRINKI